MAGAAARLSSLDPALEAIYTDQPSSPVAPYQKYRSIDPSLGIYRNNINLPPTHSYTRGAFVTCYHDAAWQSRVSRFLWYVVVPLLGHGAGSPPTGPKVSRDGYGHYTGGEGCSDLPSLSKTPKTCTGSPPTTGFILLHWSPGLRHTWYVYE